MDEDVVSIPLPCGSELDTGPPPKGSHTDDTPITHYFVGPENQLLSVVVRAILEDAGPGRPAKKYNPLLLYGATGTGKTHLARGLAAAFAARSAGGSVWLTTAVDFARSVADAFETQSVEAFRRKLHETRMVVIEDMTLLADKPAAERELIQLLDAALRAGHRVIATATSAAGTWPRILPGLQSRLGAGLSLPLASAGPAARGAILRQWAQDRGFSWSEGVVEILVEGISGSVRELLGSASALWTRSQSTGDAVDAVVARRYVAGRRGAPRVDLREIATATARTFDLTVPLLRSRTRRREVVTARGVAMYLARQLTEKNLDQIGEYFGGRDHTTVLHGCRKTETLLQTEPAVQQAVVNLRCSLEAR